MWPRTVHLDNDRDSLGPHRVLSTREKGYRTVRGLVLPEGAGFRLGVSVPIPPASWTGSGGGGNTPLSQGRGFCWSPLTAED